MSEFKNILTMSKEDQTAMLADINGLLADKSAEERVAWALENLPSTHFFVVELWHSSGSDVALSNIAAARYSCGTD